LTRGRRVFTLNKRLKAGELRAARSLSLPPRSMVGQLTLDQHIGVRIPGGQPIQHFSVPSQTHLDFSMAFIVLIIGTLLDDSVRIRAVTFFCSHILLWVPVRV
jgi:hypothetical protein